MRALTLWQPWASLVVYGPKRIENRTRRPPASLMGRLIGIHAGQSMADVPGADVLLPEMKGLSMPHGALLGFARITGTVTDSNDRWFVGPVGIRLADVVAYPEPLPMRGQQGYWPVLDTLPADAREHWGHRAAIREYDGGMPRDVAEWWALCDAARDARGLPQMSFAITEGQLLGGLKSVTRRLGWQNARPGDKIAAIGKGGRELGVLTVRDTRRERLDAITDTEVAREGFPARTADWFVRLFCQSMKCTPGDLVTRIEFSFELAPDAVASTPRSRRKMRVQQEMFA